jgi:hypothetical protein
MKLRLKRRDREHAIFFKVNAFKPIFAQYFPACLF